MNSRAGLITSIDPQEIEPLHGVRDQTLLNNLAAEMKQNGWQGRPLLVIDRESGYSAWTGSHRISAAIEAGLSLVPCYVIDERELIDRGFDPAWGHVMDYERLQILKSIGDAGGN
jgi:ParB-like chromosome segregation protein Spo0J